MQVSVSLITIKSFLIVFSAVFFLNSCASVIGQKKSNRRLAQLYYGEDHLTKIKQLTFKGESVNASYGPKNKQLIFHSTYDGLRCYAIFRMDHDGADISQVSSGKGIATSAAIAPDNYSIAYSSTQQFDELCPTKPEFSKEYVWLLNSNYDIFTSNINGGIPEQLTKSDGYDGDAVYSPAGDKILFTSSRTGDLELFMMNSDGSNVKQITHAVGYDGGASFSQDGSKIVWSASRPKGTELHEYRFQLARGMVKAGKFEIYMMTLADGKTVKLTNNAATNFSPRFSPSAKKIIFTSNISQTDGRNYDLYTLTLNTKKLERITYYDGFDGFPVFSSDGKKLVFTSSRNFRYKAETNIFSADWVEEGIYN